MLKNRLQQAIDHRQSLTIQAAGEWFTGIPIDMDVNWLLLVCIKLDPPQTGTWLVQIDSISAVGISQCDWGDRDDVLISNDDDESGEAILV
jgi:hypothetical protein